MREKYGNEAPPEVATLTPEQAWAYGYNMALHAMQAQPAYTNAETREREARDRLTPQADDPYADPGPIPPFHKTFRRTEPDGTPAST